MKKYNAFQFKILWFRLVSVSAESYGQILSFGFGIGPKPKRWFRSYTTRSLGKEGKGQKMADDP
jgi:hypothetical protein